jgi:hypothetical protein
MCRHSDTFRRHALEVLVSGTDVPHMPRYWLLWLSAILYVAFAAMAHASMG